MRYLVFKCLKTGKAETREPAVLGIPGASIELLSLMSSSGFLSQGRLPRLTLGGGSGLLCQSTAVITSLNFAITIFPLLCKVSRQIDSVCMTNAPCSQVRRRSLSLHSCKRKLNQDPLPRLCLHQRAYSPLGENLSFG